MRAVDDAALDAEMIGADATAVIALYAASLSAVRRAQRSGPFATTRRSAGDRRLRHAGGADTVGALVAAWRSAP